MPARSNTNRAKARRQKSTQPAQKRKMRASGLSPTRSSRLTKSARAQVNAMNVSQRPSKTRKKREKKKPLGAPTPEILDRFSRKKYSLPWRNLYDHERIEVKNILRNEGYTI